MIRVAIIDDEVSASSQLKGYIEKYSEEKGIPFTIMEFRDGLTLAVRWSLRGRSSLSKSANRKIPWSVQRGDEIG